MKFHTVDSSNIDKIAYDPDSKELQILFKTSGLYGYYEVPVLIYARLMAADSQGKYFNKNIKGVFEFKKLS